MPEELSAAQVSQLETMLGAISIQIDSLNAKIEEQTVAFEARIDSLEAALSLSGGTGGTTTPAALLDTISARSDSILVLASYLAEDASTAGFEICGSIEVAGEVAYAHEVEAKGEAQGDVGAWAGSGVFAGLVAWIQANLNAEVRGTLVPFGLSGCFPLGAGDPPVRPAPVGPARSPESDALRTTLLDLGSQFNLDPSMLPQALSNVAGVVQSPGSFEVQDLSTQLPLPPALASLAGDPVGTITGRFQSLSDDAFDLLCGGTNWGTNLSGVISQGCALFPDNLPSFTALATISTDFPIIQNTVSAVCGRLDTMGTRSLVIPSYTVDFGSLIGTYTVFPGYNQRLFPGYTSPC